MTYEDTPLGRAADTLNRTLQDYIPGLDAAEMERFTHRLASDALGAARLPENLDPTAEARTANLIAYHQIIGTRLQRLLSRGPLVELVVQDLTQEQVALCALIAKRLDR